MNVFSIRKKIIKTLPGLSTLFCVWVGFSGIGCDSGERDLFGVGFKCESLPQDLISSACSGAFTTSNS